jgi:hypothetical protein
VHSLQSVPQAATRFVRFLGVAGALAFFGCSSGLGPVPSGKDSMKSTIAAQAQSAVNPQVVAPIRGKAPAVGQGPRSIKQRLYTSDAAK